MIGYVPAGLLAVAVELQVMPIPARVSPLTSPVAVAVKVGLAVPAGRVAFRAVTLSARLVTRRVPLVSVTV